jgi:hypothetical protein
MIPVAFHGRHPGVKGGCFSSLPNSNATWGHKHKTFQQAQHPVIISKKQSLQSSHGYAVSLLMLPACNEILQCTLCLPQHGAASPHGLHKIAAMEYAAPAAAGLHRWHEDDDSLPLRISLAALKALRILAALQACCNGS